MRSTSSSRFLNGLAVAITGAVAVATLTGVATSASAAAPDGGLKCTQTVHGDLAGAQTVASGEKLCLRHATVGGAITVEPGGALGSRRSVINGAITLNGARLFNFCGSTTNGGAVSSIGGTGSVRMGGSRHSVDNKCRGNTVDGAVTVQGSTKPVTLARKKIVGAVTAESNADASGLPVKLAGNQIGGDLTCSENTPAPINGGRPNTVVGLRTGQCVDPNF